jgi:hypothetical protein
MAEPDLPPGHKSLFDLGVRRVAEERPPPEVDRAEVERKRQARKQREQDAAAAAAAAGLFIGLSAPQPAPAPVSKHRAWTAAKAFALEMLPLNNLARTIAWLHTNHYSVYGPSKGQQPATVDHLLVSQ